MKDTERMNKPMKIGDVMKHTQVKKIQDKLKTYHEENIIRERGRKEFLILWNDPSRTNSEKIAIVETQLAEVSNTMQCVELVGRVKIKDDPEAFYYQIDNFFEEYGLPMEQAAKIAAKILNRWPELTLQDIGLYFDHLAFGIIEVYGKLTVHAITSNIERFQKWVAYHHDIYVTNREKLIHKEGSRDFEAWINNGKPEGKVL